MKSNIALIRPPGPRLADGIVTHIERQAVDTHLAQQQWCDYIETIRLAGWDLLEVPPADDCPDAVFVEDAVVVFGNLAVITRPGADARQPEVVDVEKTVESLGLSMNRVLPPGTLDGGDVLKIGDRVYVGRGGRTNAEGIHQLRRILSPFGFSVIAVPLSKVLHLKSAVTALPDGTVIGYPPLVDDPSIFERFLPMPEESGSHVVVLDDTRVLMASDCPRSAERVAELGYRPLLVDISEFQKLEGCVTCLSVRLRDVDVVR